MKTVWKLLVITGGILVGLLLMIGHSVWIAPVTFKTRSIAIYSNKISDDFSGVKIAFFSDLYYGEYFDDDRLDKLVEAINADDPDVIIFGGDLFSDKAQIDGETIDSLTRALNQLEAPLGKFYVHGEHDVINGDSARVDTILTNAQFENITNRGITIRNKNTSAIQLVGLANMINETPDIALLNTLSPTMYTLVVTHTPDIVSKISVNVDRVVAGDSLGGQIYIPFIGGIYETQGCSYYQHGSYTLSNTVLDINNGAGTTILDARFGAPAGFILYTFHNGNDPTRTD